MLGPSLIAVDQHWFHHLISNPCGPSPFSTVSTRSPNSKLWRCFSYCGVISRRQGFPRFPPFFVLLCHSSLQTLDFLRYRPPASFDALEATGPVFKVSAPPALLLLG